MRFLCVIPSLLTIVCTVCANERGDLATRGVAFLDNYCVECHGDDNAFPGLDMRDRETLLRPKDADQPPFLVAGDPDKSPIWKVVDDHSPLQMPPEDLDQPTADEIAVLKAWIEDGAKFPEASRAKRQFVGESTIANIVLRDLEKLDAKLRLNARYFSLLHLWNDPSVPDSELRLTRAAVSKLINSLSSQPRIALPKEIDDDGLVLRIDLRDYGWTQQHHWLNLLKTYPYALLARGETAEKLFDFTFCEIPYVRADWFVNVAPRPALYHKLLTLPGHQGLPELVGTLERLLGVDVQANFDNDRIWRAGFSGRVSGVSDHNRVIERHDAKYGYYWPSYDSAGDQGRQNFSRFPLGPKFPGRQNLGAFDHDGGEYIFSLPNGLQAYMLALASGKRIDVGPQKIVRDPNQFGGSYDIQNGISCMGCHKHGMISFKDSIRVQYENRAGKIAEKVRRIYTPKEKMDEFTKIDRDRFLRSLDAACGSFLKLDEDAEKPITEFSEPVTTIAKKYDHELFLADVARELGMPDDEAAAQAAGIRGTASELKTIIKFSERLRRFELLPLTVDEPITRKQWESAFGAVARELGVGIPFIVN